MRALTSEPPYMIFFKDKVRMHSHLALLPKVVSQFHMSQDIYLLVFFPNPHASTREQALHCLDVRRALAFYRERTKELCKSPTFYFDSGEDEEANACPPALRSTMTARVDRHLH